MGVYPFRAHKVMISSFIPLSEAKVKTQYCLTLVDRGQYNLQGTSKMAAFEKFLIFFTDLKCKFNIF